jgi:hypothetical protein
LTNPALPSSEEKTRQLGPYPARVTRLLLGLIGVCLLCLTSLYYAEVHPRYIELPVPPPKDQFEVDFWLSTTYSVRLSAERVFLVSRETYVSNGGASRNSWDSIVAYFDGKLDRLGWVRSEIWAPCKEYLREGQFLPDGENGIVHYFRKGYEDRVYYGSEYNGDTICLAVWPESWNADGSPTGFNVDLLSARRSFLSQFMDIFSD